MVTKAMGGCVSSQKREIIVPKTPVNEGFEQTVCDN